MKLTVKTWNQIRPYTVVKQFQPIDVTADTGAGGPIAAYDATRTGGQQSGFDKNRVFRAAVPWLAAGIDIRAEGVIFASADVVAKDGTDLDPAAKKVADYIEAFLDHPDPGGVSTDKAKLFGPWIGDALVGGRGAIRKYLGDDGYIERLRTLDGERVIDNPKYDYDDPEKQEAKNDDGTPEMPRFYYLEKDERTGRINERRGEPLFESEICLLEPTPTSYGAGLCPVGYLDAFLTAHQELFTAIQDVQRMGQPPGVFKVPSAQPGTIAKLQSEWKKRAQGKSAAIFASLPADTQWLPLGDTNLTERGSFQWYDIMVRGIAASLRISTVAIGWTQTTLERNAVAQGESQDEGQFNLLRLVQGAWNSSIMPFFQGADGLLYRYVALPSDDESENAETLAQWSGGHFILKSPDELRRLAGDDPMVRTAGTPLDQALKEIWVVTGTGPMPISLYLGTQPVQTVPGYDPTRGEVDQEKAQAEQQAKLEAQQAAMGGIGGPPGAGNGQNGPPDGSQPPPGPTAPPNGNGGGQAGGKMDPAALSAILAAKKSATDAGGMTPVDIRDPVLRALAADYASELEELYPNAVGKPVRGPARGRGDRGDGADRNGA